MMKMINSAVFAFLLLGVTLFSQDEIIKKDGIEVLDEENNSSYVKSEEYNLSAESDFYLEAALRDYSELTDCEEDAKDQMAEEAMATVDLCPTRNIDIRLGHPIEIQKVKVTKRKLSNDECMVEATYTLSTLPPEEMAEIDAVCQDEYNNYGASLMLQDGLWQGIQLNFGVGYSEGGVADMQLNSEGQVFHYKYVGAPMMTTDALYMYKLPVANLYVLGGGELGWVLPQADTKLPSLAEDPVSDGGSPYIFRVGFFGGLGYRFFMRYDVQAQVGYQFQYLYRTLKGGDTYNGYENNLMFALKGAYHFHENFAVWVKMKNNTSSSIALTGLTYEFWD